MNIITSRYAISVFPRSSFISRKFAVSAQRTFDTTSAAHIKAVVRNTTGLAMMKGGETPPREMRVPRRVGDELCWILPVTIADGMPTSKSSVDILG